MSNYGEMLRVEWLLLPVVYTTIRTTGNPFDMVVGDRGENVTPAAVRLTSNPFLHVPQTSRPSF